MAPALSFFRGLNSPDADSILRGKSPFFLRSLCVSVVNRESEAAFALLTPSSNPYGPLFEGGRRWATGSRGSTTS